MSGRVCDVCGVQENDGSAGLLCESHLLGWRLNNDAAMFIWHTLRKEGAPDKHVCSACVESILLARLVQLMTPLPRAP